MVESSLDDIVNDKCRLVCVLPCSTNNQRKEMENVCPSCGKGFGLEGCSHLHEKPSVHTRKSPSTRWVVRLDPNEIAKTKWVKWLVTGAVRVWNTNSDGSELLTPEALQHYTEETLLVVAHYLCGLQVRNYPCSDLQRELSAEAMAIFKSRKVAANG